MADDEIAVFWEKAVRALRSSRAQDVDVDSAFSVAYNASLQGATAVLLGAGYRAVGRDHHHSIFAGVAALEAGELSRAARDADDMRQDRHNTYYGAVMIELAQLAEMQDVAGRLLAAGHAWLADARPGLNLTDPTPLG
ncbi:MAG TPA: hypothetical protein VFS20_31720 [Longimicrobium sp.]|nr:hypothetical protein [Longimicrobium sp.]